MKKKISLFVLLLVFLVSSWPFFNANFFYIHDFTQGARIVEMSRALSDGHLPVRWTKDFGFGYGMPLFEFYAPLPYYVGSVFYLVGFSLIDSIKLIFLISTVVTLLGGYKLGKQLFGRSGGLLLSALLTLAPYRAVNLYVRGALSELWGLMALPLILLGIIRVVKGEKYGWSLLVVSLMTLLLSHNLTSMMFIPLSLVFGASYLLMNSEKKNKRISFFFKKLCLLAGGFVSAVSLSAFYIFPAFLEKDLTIVSSTILQEYFNYKIHFVFLKQFFESNWMYGGSNYGPIDEMSFFLGTGQLLGLLLVGVLFLRIITTQFSSMKDLSFKKIIRFKKQYLLLITSVFLLGISLFMTLPNSEVIWDLIKVFSYIQFPWRWLSLAALFLALTVAFVTLMIKNAFQRYFFVLILILITILSSHNFFKPEKYLKDTAEYYYDDPNLIRTEMSKTLPDYISTSIGEANISPVALDGEMFMCEVRSRVGDENCDFEFEVLEDLTQQKVVRVNLEADSEIEFAISDFPGWFVKVDGQLVQHNTSDFGVISVPVSAGEHEILLEFKNSRVRAVADRVSLTALAILLSIFFWYHGGQAFFEKTRKK